MPLCFSNEGPEFPNEFIDSLLAGEVVFLCGTGSKRAADAGIFRRLVERTYEALGLERTDSEQSAFDKGLFEEVLGALSRRLSDPYAVTAHGFRTARGAGSSKSQSASHNCSLVA